MQVNPSEYRESMNEMPLTSPLWTSILRASDTSSGSWQQDMEKLITLYDKPLLKLFEAMLSERRERAEDWKQDFIITHIMSGKVFSAAKPGLRFRTFLATSAKNFVLNKFRQEQTLKRKTTDGAKPMSDIASANNDSEQRNEFEKSLTDQHCETLLTRFRAHDAYNNALDHLQKWADQQPEATPMQEVLSKFRDPNSSQFKRGKKRDDLTRKMIEQFQYYLKLAVREEVALDGNESEETVVGREIAVFFDALQQL